MKEEVKILNREGSKNKYAQKIISLFPEHDTYIEPFLGTGAIFFNKPLAKYNILNDHSSFIYNFFNQIKSKEGLQSLYERIEKSLIYPKVLLEDKNNLKSQILISLYSLYGSGSGTFRTDSSNSKKLFLERLKKFENHFYEYLNNAVILNKDIFSFLASFNKTKKLIKPFIYLDPPYSISKGRLDDNKGWDINQLEKLINILLEKEIKFMISEFNDKEVLNLFREKNLFIEEIGKSKGIAGTFGHTKKEIVATNYLLPKNALLDLFTL